MYYQIRQPLYVLRFNDQQNPKYPCRNSSLNTFILSAELLPNLSLADYVKNSMNTSTYSTSFCDFDGFSSDSTTLQHILT